MVTFKRPRKIFLFWPLSMVWEEDFIKYLGIHLRQIRERKNLSQQSLADISDLPKTSIGRIERAEINPTIKSLIKIANALEIEPKELLDINTKINK